MKVGVLGLGDVGQAVKRLCLIKHDVYGRDLNIDELKNRRLDILHICIPWTQKFESIVATTIRELKPELTIINSTVRPGTTQSLYRTTKRLLVHSPVNGVHPHLYKYLKKFIKPIGAVNTKAYKLAQKHFEDLGVKTVRFDSPFETELAKILCTTYYAWNIVFEKWVHALCRQKRANFTQIYSQWNRIYNRGYKDSKPNVIRPILKHFPGPIGGHCVIPNAQILNSWLRDEFTQLILDQNKRDK